VDVPLVRSAELVKAMGAMALLPICDSSSTCEHYNNYRAHPWSPFLLRRANPGSGPHRTRVFLRRTRLAPVGGWNLSRQSAFRISWPQTHKKNISKCDDSGSKTSTFGFVFTILRPIDAKNAPLHARAGTTVSLYVSLSRPFSLSASLSLSLSLSTRRYYH